MSPGPRRGSRTSTTDGRGRRRAVSSGERRPRTVADRIEELRASHPAGGDHPSRADRPSGVDRGSGVGRTAGPAGSAAAERARRIRAERAADRDRQRPAAKPAKPKRRTDRRFKARRRIGLAVLVVAVLAALGGGFWAVLVYTGIATVEEVEVTGALTVSREAVTDAAAVETGVPLATVDTKGIAERVALLPGIGSVAVSRGWPHTVEIAVTERTAVALARTPQGVTLVDPTGVAYRQAPEVPPALPMLGFGAVGPGDPATEAALAVLAALPPDLRAQVRTVDVDSAAVEPTVRLGLGERQVRFGTPDRAARKVAVLVPLLTQEGTVYDVSSPELPTITR